MKILDFKSLWGYSLFLIFYYIYDKFLRNTSFRKIGKPLSLLLCIGFILLPDFLGVKNEYLYRLLKTIPAFFAFNFLNKEKRR